MLLWDCDNRSYSYFIEVSTDQQHWTLVVDKRNEQCSGWQSVVFKKQPVSFVKITGTLYGAKNVLY